MPDSYDSIAGLFYFGHNLALFLKERVFHFLHPCFKACNARA